MEKLQKKKRNYLTFMEHCNYGHVQGIVGINCKHFLLFGMDH